MVGAGIEPYGRLALWLLLINYSIEGEKRMRTYRSVLKMVLVLGLVAGITSPAAAFLGNKFEKEVEKETGAVKLVREVQSGGYNVVTTEELKKWIDSGKDMMIVDTMPYEDS